MTTSSLAEEDATAGYPKDAIAIIGMAGRFPGAENVEEYWDLLTAGKVMFSKAPADRFGPSARTVKGQPFWGNFLKDIEGFDHSFFKRSPREAASTDPQHRLLLELAYEALESSGYFAGPRDRDVGVYIGGTCADYDFNVASNPANAYSAVGTLRCFMSGKISHYFGWTAPAMTLDTACSASAVAIHTACIALRTGQCSQALAGGINMMTAPYFYENFNAARFLTSTGASKSFSDDADGYCRGEGGGIIVLKTLAGALRDDDNIIGVIGGIGLNQSDNSVPITVPHPMSQSELYKQVCRQAGITTDDVSFVEAHGTGTPVGDPIEIESVRRAFGTPHRDTPLIISSTKGNIGHLEAASGVTALIKSILQIEHRLMPRLPTFKKLNPSIPPLEPDSLCVPTYNIPLTHKRLVACVNNYGASGSNAAIIILEPPQKNTPSTSERSAVKREKFPIQLTAASIQSLLAYCASLDSFCQRLRTLEANNMVDALPNLAYSLSKRLNRDLAYSLTFTASNLDELQQQLREQTPKANRIRSRPDRMPVVLCFGGQVSDKIGIDKELWQECALLRYHLDACDSAITGLGFPSIYPAIFEKTPITDVVTLHAATFASQYASARAWLESGLHVDAVIGHSFGQLTAMCVSGMLSLQDGVRLVLGRAALMESHWGEERGTMILVQTDNKTIEQLRANGHDFEIACFNGPSSHVIVSDKASGDVIIADLKKKAIRHKRLEVPYGFHSRFTEPLLPHLENLAAELIFHEPKIPIETCTDVATWPEPSPQRIVAHTREPVYFASAIKRLQHKFGACTWVEAGFGSGILNMAKAVLGPSSSDSTYSTISLDKASSIATFADAAVSLWNSGQPVQFLNFCKLQPHEYQRLRLPPYVFDKSKHWLPLMMSESLGTTMPPAITASTNPRPAELPPCLIQLNSINLDTYHFDINQNSEEYRNIVKDIKDTRKNAAPVSLYVELISRAFTITSGGKISSPILLENLQTLSPPKSGSQDLTHMELQRDSLRSSFKIMAGKTCCVEGDIHEQQTSSSLYDEFNRYERVLCFDDVASLLDDPRSQSIRGTFVYKVLSRTTNYPQWYRGITSVATMGSKIAARVVRPLQTPPLVVTKESQTDIAVLESVLQVVYLHANCLLESSSEEVYRFTNLQRLQFAPHFQGQTLENQTSWNVLAITTGSGSHIGYDVFVYDVQTRKLALMILGVQLITTGVVNVPMDSLSVSNPLPLPRKAISPPGVTTTAKSTAIAPVQEHEIQVPHPGKDPRKSIFDGICRLLKTLADIPSDKIRKDASFDDLGIDSLMATEVVSELQSIFKVDIKFDEMVALSDIDSLVDYLDEKGAVGACDAEGASSASSSGYGTSLSTTPSTPIEPEESGPKQQWQSETSFLGGIEALDVKGEMTGFGRLDANPQPAGRVIERAGNQVEELVFKSVDGVDLVADVYFPRAADPPGRKRDVALLMHGGSYFLFGRKDVPMNHIEALLERGFLPVSIDYRLLPETTLVQGPMTDCCDALQWAKDTLPFLSLSGPRVQINPSTILAIGWSGGGQLAMSLGFTAQQRGIEAPDAIFALYPPSDFEAEYWHKPCYPVAAEEELQEINDILAGVQSSPILDYAPMNDRKPTGLSLTLKDPRAKIMLHAFWNTQTVPILVNGLPQISSIVDPDAEHHVHPPKATAAQVHDISTLWQIKQGNYRTPTFIVHGNADDWLPLSMSEGTIRELQDRGIPSGLAVPEKCSHSFDLFPSGDPLSTGWPAIEQGYDFICRLLNH